jgi:RNA polymerase sigma factor (sigma-70 family)
MGARGEAELLARAAALPGEPRLDVPPDLARDEHVDALASALLQRFRERDDPQAFELLVRLTEPRLMRLARRVTSELRPGVEADDLVAGLYTRLFTDLRAGRPPVRNFLGLACTALRNDALNQLRRRRRAEARQRAWQQLRAGECEPDPIHLADEREQAQQMARIGALMLALVAKGYERLPERDRLVLRAREMEGLSYEDIGVTFGLPRGQVGMVILRARRRLEAQVRQSLSTPALAPASASAPAARRAGGARP